MGETLDSSVIRKCQLRGYVRIASFPEGIDIPRHRRMHISIKNVRALFPIDRIYLSPALTLLNPNNCIVPTNEWK